MGQYTVIIVLSAIVLSGVILFNARSSTSAAGTELTAYQADRIAREASQVALRDVVRELNAKPDAWTSDLSTAQGTFNIPPTMYALDDDIETTYEVTLTEMYLGAPTNPADPDRVHLRIDGFFDSWSEASQSVEPTVYVVEVVYERGWVDVNVPGAFRSAILSDQFIDLQDDAEISGDVHSNGQLAGSNSISVNGTGTYTSSASADDSRFTGGVAERDPIVLPPVAIPPASYHALAPASWTGSINPGDDPTGTLPAGDNLTDGWLTDAMGSTVIGKGTETDPYVLYVDGDFAINGNVQLIGHIRIYIRGNFEVLGNSSLSSVSAALPDLSQDVSTAQAWADANLPDGVTIGIYVNGDVILNNRTFLAATVYANGTATHAESGHVMVVGSITAHGPVDMQRNAKVHYHEGADSVYDPGITHRAPESLRLVAYREWADRP